MKRIILKYQDFLKTPKSPKLSEAVLSGFVARQLSKIKVVDDVKAIHDRIFEDKERIYMPFDLSTFGIKDEKSKIQEDIESLLTDKGYEIVSYTQNQCIKIGQKNITKIGKVLLSKNINRQDLADAYALEVDSLRNVKDSSGLLVVFSRNYDDVASMSTKKAWTSCQNLDNGSYSDYVAKDLEQGSIIAYLIKSTDKEILDPEARILIKPFINIKDSKDIVLLPATAVYHRGTNNGTPLAYPNFPKFVMSWVKMVQPDINGTYKMQPDVYQDGSVIHNIKKTTNLTDEELERIESPQNQDDLKFGFDYYGVDLDISKVQMDSDKLWVYNGNINFYELNLSFLEEIPKCFKNLKEIKGDFNCSETPLKSFKGLNNLTEIRGSLWCSKTSIRDFTGLNNLIKIGLTFDCTGTSIKDFTGLDELTKIGGGLFCSGTSIKDFTGLDNLKEVVGNLYCYNTPLKSFKGLENLTEIRGNLDCSWASITDFTGLKNIKKIGGSLNCVGTSITSFNGLENLKEVVGNLNCYSTPLKSFKGLENLTKISNNLGCSRTSITDFTGLDNLKEIGGNLNCHETSITSFKGLEQCELNPDKITPVEVREKYIEWKETITK